MRPTTRKVRPMRHEPTISSATNPRLRAIEALRRRRARDQQGLTVIEGFEEIDLALRSGVHPQSLYVCQELFSPAGRAGSQQIGDQHEVLAQVREAGVEVVHLDRTVFEKVSYREGPDGLLAVAPAPGRPLSQLLSQPLSEPAVGGIDPLVLVLQGVEKPGNVGAMLRTADAAGVAAVVAADPVTDLGNPNVVRASKGTVYSVPTAAASTEQTVQWARERGLRLVVTTPETSVLHTEADLRGPVAVVVGSEKHGCDEQMLAAADVRVRIAMHGRANSLNVSVAAAVVLYEAVRQRGV